MNYHSHFLLTLLLLSQCITRINSDAMELNTNTFDDVINDKKLVFINFYADWCRFSNMLKPIFNQAADEIIRANENVLLARVNCDASKELAQRFHITKYPTIKLWRNGQAARREYRGERSVDAFKNYIEDQLKDPVQYVNSLNELEERHAENKKSFVGFFEDNNSQQFRVFSKTAHSLRDECKFIVGYKSSFHFLPIAATYPQVSFRELDLEQEVYKYGFELESAFRTWIKQKCIPIVREITFDNGEEMTELGLPFVLLFYDPEHTEPIKSFREVIEKELLDEKESVSFLTADGVTFAHPLSHLGKNRGDLPLIAIDSFRHMYIFPNFNDIKEPGKLKEFLTDFHSGKLHNEFHHGPSKEEAKSENSEQKLRDPIQPPLSTFDNLKPSKKRYSFRDEL